VAELSKLGRAPKDYAQHRLFILKLSTMILEVTYKINGLEHILVSGMFLWLDEFIKRCMAITSHVQYKNRSRYTTESLDIVLSDAFLADTRIKIVHFATTTSPEQQANETSDLYRQSSSERDY
jgi:type IV secretory pathway VirB3-like protein